MYNLSKNIEEEEDRESSGIQISETTREQSVRNDSPNNSLNLNNRPQKFDKKNFIYVTPAIKKKKNLEMPSTPKKRKRSSEYDEYKIKGVNLTEIFEAIK